MALVATEEPNQPARRERAWEKWAVGLSWLATSAAGAAFIARCWSSHGSGEIGSLRAALFVVIMAVVHALGYLKYRGQFRSDRQRSDPLLKEYLSAVKATAIQQGILITLAALTLDMGQAIHLATMAALAYWSMFALIVVRRLEFPTRVDIHAIRWRFLYSYFAVAIVAPLWWAHVGRTY